MKKKVTAVLFILFLFILSTPTFAKYSNSFTGVIHSAFFTKYILTDKRFIIDDKVIDSSESLWGVGEGTGSWDGAGEYHLGSLDNKAFYIYNKSEEPKKIYIDISFHLNALQQLNNNAKLPFSLSRIYNNNVENTYEGRMVKSIEKNGDVIYTVENLGGFLGANGKNCDATIDTENVVYNGTTTKISLSDFEEDFVIGHGESALFNVHIDFEGLWNLENTTYSKYISLIFRAEAYNFA